MLLKLRRIGDIALRDHVVQVDQVHQTNSEIYTKVEQICFQVNLKASLHSQFRSVFHATNFRVAETNPDPDFADVEQFDQGRIKQFE